MSGLQDLMLGYGRPRDGYVEFRRESPVPVTSKGAPGHVPTPRHSNVYRPVRGPTIAKTLTLLYSPDVRHCSCADEWPGLLPCSVLDTLADTGFHGQNPFEQARRDAEYARINQKKRLKKLEDELHEAVARREEKILKDRTIGQRASRSSSSRPNPGERGRAGSHKNETRERHGQPGGRAQTPDNGTPTENRAGRPSHRGSR